MAKVEVEFIGGPLDGRVTNCEETALRKSVPAWHDENGVRVIYDPFYELAGDRRHRTGKPAMFGGWIYKARLPSRSAGE